VQGKLRAMFGAHHTKEGVIEAARQFKMAVDGLQAGREVGVNAVCELQHAGVGAARELGRQLVWVAVVVMAGIVVNTIVQALFKS